MSSLLGTTLSGRYRLESRIGSGGMSTVYRAHDETLERFVAIKLMNREVATDSDQLERFRREARAVARLSHPNIVHVIDAGEDESRPYIVFEYIDGRDPEGAHPPARAAADPGGGGLLRRDRARPRLPRTPTTSCTATSNHRTC